MGTNWSRIEKYTIAEKSSSSFMNFNVCRNCAEKKAQQDFDVEFDKWAQKYPDEYEFECDFCGQEVVETDNTEYPKIENVIY